MDSSANPVLLLPTASSPWWKKSMSLTQLVFAFTLALIFIGSGQGIGYLITHKSQSALLQAPAMAAAPEVKLMLELADSSSIVKSDDKIYKLTGNTGSNLPVVVFNQNHSVSGRSDQAGTFRIEVQLDEGVNDLMIVVLSPDGQEKTIIQQVAYQAPK